MLIWQIFENESESGIDFSSYYDSHCSIQNHIIKHASQIIYMFMVLDICSFISHVSSHLYLIY